MSNGSKCKCGESSIVFKHLSKSEMDGKWECSLCVDNMKEKSVVKQASDSDNSSKPPSQSKIIKKSSKKSSKKR